MSAASPTTVLLKLLDKIGDTKASDAVGVAAIGALERMNIAETESSTQIQIAKIRPEPLTAQAVENVMGYTGRRAER